VFNAVIDVCDWTGVDCGWEGGTVQSINLSGSNLATTIPSELGLLTELKTLDLSNNLIIGTIPPEVAALPNLEEFILLNNSLSGTLPKFASKKLRKLDLENNNLSGRIPPDFGYNHQEMNYFSLCTNSFSGTIPPSLGQMTKLETLGLSENQLYGECYACVQACFNDADIDSFIYCLFIQYRFTPLRTWRSVSFAIPVCRQ